MPYILFFSAMMLLASLVLPRQSREFRFVSFLPRLERSPDFFVRFFSLDAPLVLFILPWLFAFVVSFAFIWGNGILFVLSLSPSLLPTSRLVRTDASVSSFAFCSYVSWPKLNPPSEILEYEGAGFKSLARGRGLDLPMLKGRAKRIVKKAVKFEQ